MKPLYGWVSRSLILFLIAYLRICLREYIEDEILSAACITSQL